MKHITATWKQLLAVALAIAGLPAAHVLAQGDATLGSGIVQGYAPPARNLPATILGIINFVLVIVGVLALAFMVYGGFLYITSRGDDDQVSTAKGIIINAVIGIVVIGVAAALVNFVVDAILLGAR